MQGRCEERDGGRGVEKAELSAVKEWCEAGFGGVEVSVVPQDEVC